MEWGFDNARAFAGIAAIFGIAWLMSENRREFPWRIVIGAVFLQFVFALVIFGVPKIFGFESLFGSGSEPNPVIKTLEDATRSGTGFVFGYVGDNAAAGELMSASPPPQFFFQILPIVIVVAALSAMLWHWRILRWITRAFAFIFRKTMGLGGATSLAVSANVFMGMTEAPVLVKPYVKGMTRSELFILMTAGFATIAGSVLIIYTTFLEGQLDNPLAQLLTASIMAAPAAVALALTIVPETEPATERAHEPDFEYDSTMDAFATGASDGLKIVLNIATMLIAALALLYIGNVLFGLLPDVNGQALTIQRVLGWVFSPIMYMIGVPFDEAAKAGSLMGIKTVLTEFVAFIELGEVEPGELSERARIITTHAICGFANFGSMGILIGGLVIIEPSRRDTFLSLAWKTLIAGTLATCLSGAVVGALPEALFISGS
ncbi:MAG: nucleoside transporter C-terminal domain-containing protein [Pseudomonadota bacterium]